MLAEALVCPDCSEPRLVAVIARDPDAPPSVYLGCSACKGLVASFRLDQAFLNKRAMESVVSALGTNIFESGREIAETIEKLSAEATEGYNRALAELERLRAETQQKGADTGEGDGKASDEKHADG